MKKFLICFVLLMCCAWAKADLVDPEYVDLGLTVYWAKCNYPDTDPTTTPTKYYPLSADGTLQTDLSNFEIANDIDITGTQYDMVAQNCVDGWHLPTLAQFQELIDNCDLSYDATLDLIVAKSKINGNEVLFAKSNSYATSIVNKTGDSTMTIRYVSFAYVNNAIKIYTTFAASYKIKMYLMRPVKYARDVALEPEPEVIPIPETVDLGLSVDWAATNYLAELPTDEPELYYYGSATDATMDVSGYSAEGNYNITGAKGDLISSKYGEGWHLPTVDQYKELISNCTFTYDATTGIITATSKLVDGASIQFATKANDDGGFDQYYASSDFFLYKLSSFNLAKSTNQAFHPTINADGSVSFKIGKNTLDQKVYALRAVKDKEAGLPQPEAVDLGLSAKWATANYGAAHEWQYCGSTYQANVVRETKNIMMTDEDVVSKSFDSDYWCTPTTNLMYELYTKCTWERSEVEGISGYKVTGPNGNSIFLPGQAPLVEGDTFDGGRYCTSNVAMYYNNGGSLRANGGVTFDTAKDAAIANIDWNDYAAIRPVQLIPATGIDVSDYDNLTLNLKSTTTKSVTPTITPAEATIHEFAWSSDNEDVVEVQGITQTSNGVSTHRGSLTAKSYGFATITVKTIDGSNISESFDVIVAPLLVSSITIKDATAKNEIQTAYLHPDQEITSLSVTVESKDADDNTYSWVSDDDAVATVNDNGNIVGVAPGTTIVKAMANDASKVYAELKVIVDENAIDSEEGSWAYLGGDILIYSRNLGASADNVAGDIYCWGATTPGEDVSPYVPTATASVDIAGTEYDAVTAAMGSGCRMWSYNDLVDDLLNNLGSDYVCYYNTCGALLSSGKTDDVAFLPGIATSTYGPAATTWLSTTRYYNYSLAQYHNARLFVITSSSFAIKAHTLSTSTGYSVRPVKDVVRISALSFEKSKYQLGYETIKLTPKYEPENANVLKYKWTSSDESVATVDSNGVVTGLAEGTVTITATALDLGAATASTTVEVSQKYTDVSNISYDKSLPTDVYNLQGIRIKANATADDIKTLAPGIYIINAKKVIIK